MYKVYVKNLDNRELSYPEGTDVETVLKDVRDELPFPVYVSKLDNAYRALTHKLTHDSAIEFLDLRNQEAWQVYQNSLILIFIKAVHDVLGKDVRVNIRNALNKGIFVTMSHRADAEDLDRIEQRMREITDADIPITKEHYTKDGAMIVARKQHMTETMKLLESITNIDDVQLYSLDDEQQIFYNILVPSTGYIQYFGLRQYRSGLILQYPQQSDPTRVADYVEQPRMYEAFSEAIRWGHLMEVNHVCDLNESIIEGGVSDLILLQEALHEKKISDIADMIKEKGSRVVLICGPSSSGKTTFAKRLCIQLRVNGFDTLYIGTDDYYKEFHERVYDENGEPDLDSIKAIDTELFRDHIKALLNGEEVDIPRFDFSIPGKVYGEKITRLHKNTLLVIEGIHALNREMTDNIPDEDKFKIYISPLTPISIDHHNRISATDARLLRRLIRDSRTRNSDAAETIRLWPKVRASEDTSIFPYNSEADVFFNSNCIYEIALIKKYAEHLLKRVKRTQPEYAEAQRLLDFLKFFDVLYEDIDIANNSIIREFIGGSVLVK
ncbi:MAG: nucleoside kinase [Oscillospiraceae bacterium]|nr:nucleoside kinase [Oscillospiraceae bacterium]